MQTKVPPEISKSIVQFQHEHPDPRRVCFIMMRFGDTAAHSKIVAAIKSGVAAHGITALRADEKDYHDDLFPNVLTYIYGCSFGIAICERLEREEFNPNVSLEMGYMLALGKPVMILKDKTLQTLPTDLVGKLYKQFDPQDPGASIPAQVSKWLTGRQPITQASLHEDSNVTSSSGDRFIHNTSDDTSTKVVRIRGAILQKKANGLLVQCRTPRPIADRMARIGGGGNVYVPPDPDGKNRPYPLGDGTYHVTDHPHHLSKVDGDAIDVDAIETGTSSYRDPQGTERTVRRYRVVKAVR